MKTRFIRSFSLIRRSADSLIPILIILGTLLTACQPGPQPAAAIAAASGVGVP